MDRSHDTETDAERERLRSLVARLSDKELSRPMPGGWTVSAVLAHIAFWDARAIYFLDKWDPAVSRRRTSPRTPMRQTTRQSRCVWRFRHESRRS